MDPLTAALQLANTIAGIVKLTIESMPPAERAQFAKIHLDNLQHWQEFIESIRGAFHPPAAKKGAE